MVMVLLVCVCVIISLCCVLTARVASAHSRTHWLPLLHATGTVSPAPQQTGSVSISCISTVRPSITRALFVYYISTIFKICLFIQAITLNIRYLFVV